MTRLFQPRPLLPGEVQPADAALQVIGRERDDGIGTYCVGLAILDVPVNLPVGLDAAGCESDPFTSQKPGSSASSRRRPRTHLALVQK